MAALVLSVAGAAAGSAVLGPVGAIVGRLVGAVAGNVIDQALFGARRNVSLEGPRLSDLAIMASTEGAPIARVYALLNVRFGSYADKPSPAKIHVCPLLSVVSTDRRNTLSLREKMECDDGSEISSWFYRSREDGVMGSLATG